MRKLGLIIIVIAVGVFLNQRFGSAEPDPGMVKAAALLEGYYKKFPVGGGWYVRAIKVEDSSLSVRVVIPTPQADRLMAVRTFAQQRAAIKVVCPGQLEEIWRRKPAKASIYITGEIENGSAFVDAWCKSQK